MSLSDKFAELSSKLVILSNKIKQLASQPRPNALESDDAMKLDGNTRAQVNTILTSKVVGHSTQVPDPHETTAQKLDIYTKTEFDNKLKTMIPPGILPISNYGLQNYLPLGITGSFEGASTDPTYKGYAMALEEDGTLVALRNGTNGSRRGVFYCHIPEAEIGSLTAPVRTGKQYRPSFLPPTVRLSAIVCSSEELFVARLENEADGTFYGWSVTLTNGTMDEKLHEGCIIVGNEGFGSGWSSPRTANLIIGGTVYFFTFAGGSGLGSEFAVYVRTCLVSDIRNGTLTQLTLVPSITTQSYSGPITSNKIALASAASSTDAATKPLVLVGGPLAAVNVQHGDNVGIAAAANEAGLVRIAVSSRSYFATSFSSVGATNTMSVVYDPVSRTAVVDPGINDQAKLIAAPDGRSFTRSGDFFLGDIANVLFNSSGNGYFDNKILTRNGVWFNFFSGSTVDAAAIRRTNVVNFVSRFETLKFSKQSNNTGILTASDNPLFPTPLGSSIGGVICIDSQNILLHAIGRRESDGLLARAVVNVKLEGGPRDWTYRSANGNPTRTGYSPARQRIDIATKGLDLYTWSNPIVEVVNGSVNVSGYHFTSVSGVSETRGQKLNSDMTVSGTPMTVSGTLLNTTARNVAASVAGTVGAWTTAYGQLVVPQTSGVPPFFWTYIYNATTRINYCVLSKVTGLVKSGNVVTSIGIGKTYTPVAYGGSSTGFGPAAALHCLTTGAWCFYDTPTAVLIGGPACHNYSTIGNSTFVNVRFKWNKATQEFVDSSFRFSNFNPIPLTDIGYFVHPTFGFCQCLSSSSSSDLYTKSIIYPFAKTEAEFDAYVRPPESEAIVLASQDVSEGWSVYFTDPTPVFIMGSPYVLGIRTIDLKDIHPTPTNKKFYVYVEMIDGAPQYVITLTEKIETFSTMLIGTVTTNATQIERIDVEKVYRIDTVRMSTNPIGSGIPTSSGHPADNVKLNWT